jgi:glycosyltransferase involved in cell wall biosynthesis
MKHVALFTDSYGTTRNGVTIAVQLLRDDLLADSHRVTVVAPGGRRKRVRAAAPGDIEMLLGSLRLPGLHPRVATGLGFRSCLRALRAARPDVVHVHGFGPVSLLGVHFARRTRTPLLITWHTDAVAYVAHYRYLAPFLHFWAAVVRKACGSPFFAARDARTDHLAATLVRTADLVLAPSEKTARKLRELRSETPIRTVPTSVVPISAAAATPVPLPEIAGPMLLYVGRVAPEKGIALLLDAFDILRESHPEATLVMAGDVRCARGLKRRLREARLRNVVLTGEVERGCLAGLYERAELFVFPSLTDTQGLVLQEAAHAGLPIVVVDGELRSPGATTVCEPSPRALAAAMADVLGDDFRPATPCRATRAAEARDASARDRHAMTEIYQTMTAC